MIRIRLAVGLAAVATAFAVGTPSHATTVCVTEPELNDVYTGCTTYDAGQKCVKGGGAVLGARYAIACSPR